MKARKAKQWPGKYDVKPGQIIATLPTKDPIIMREGTGKSKLLDEIISKGKPVVDDAVFVKTVVSSALNYVIKSLPDRIRNQFSGEVNHEADLVSGGYIVSVKLKHVRNRHEIEQIINIPRDTLNLMNEREMQSYGQMLGEGLKKALKAYDLHAPEPEPAPPPPDRVEHYPGQFRKVTDLPKAEKPPEPPKAAPCVICGPEDDKYPAWDECSHTPEERKGDK